MPTESELRDAIRSSANITPHEIDTDAVLRKARARRMPKQLAFSTLSVLAVVGVVTLGVTTVPGLQPGHNGASDSALMSSVPDSARTGTEESSFAKGFESDTSQSSRCGMPAEDPIPSSSGLALSLDFPQSAPAEGSSISGTVTITNSGPKRVSGTTAVEPMVTVFHEGITVWHSNGLVTEVAALIQLDPGQSYSYDARFTPVECTHEDDEAEQVRDDLLALLPGHYEISAEILFVPDGVEPGENIRVGGPAVTIELR